MTCHDPTDEALHAWRFAVGRRLVTETIAMYAAAGTPELADRLRAVLETVRELDEIEQWRAAPR